MNINQKLYSHYFENVNPNFVRLGTVLFIGLGFCLLSGVVLGLFDKRAEIITKRKSGDGLLTLSLSLSLSLSGSKSKNSCLTSLLSLYIINCHR